MQKSKEEIACARWLDSPLFAGGVDPDKTSMYTQLTSGASTTEALRMDALRRPLVGVHMSPHLDVLERVVMAGVHTYIYIHTYIHTYSHTYIHTYNAHSVQSPATYIRSWQVCCITWAHWRTC